MPRRTRSAHPLRVDVDDGVYQVTLRDPTMAAWRDLLMAKNDAQGDLAQIDAVIQFLESVIESIDCVPSISDLDMREAMAMAEAVTNFFGSGSPEPATNGSTSESNSELSVA